jgi:putative flippase GtrA
MESKAPRCGSATGECRAPLANGRRRAKHGGIEELAQLNLVAKVRLQTAKLMRFGLVGLLSAAVYSVAVVGLVAMLKLDGKLANVIGYVVALPINFVGHRHFTFVSKGIVSGDAIRFCILHGINIGISTAGFGILVDGMKLPYWFGILGALVLVPISTFIVMDVWVFAEQRRPVFYD